MILGEKFRKCRKSPLIWVFPNGAWRFAYMKLPINILVVNDVTLHNIAKYRTFLDNTNQDMKFTFSNSLAASSHSVLARCGVCCAKFA